MYRFIKGKDFPVFKRHCQDYFMEVVSTLCFGSYKQPEPALIKMLMQMMFTEPLIPSTSGIMTNSVPEIKSSLLQLLLDVKYVYHRVRTHTYNNSSVYN